MELGSVTCQRYHAAMQVARIRKQLGLTQVELAEIVGVEQPTISRLERGSGNVTLRLIKSVSAALGVTPAELLADDREIAELALIQAFRSLPRERQEGWPDMARAMSHTPASVSQ